MKPSCRWAGGSRSARCGGENGVAWQSWRFRNQPGREPSHDPVARPTGSAPEQVRDYQVHLLALQTSWTLFNQTVSALRFLYRVTLKQTWALERLPYGKRPKRLPCVLSQQQVLQFLSAVDHLVSRMALATAYAGGLRVSEVAVLRVEDIDSARMLIHVRQGKGQKDRIVPLSKVLLESLRGCWRVFRSKECCFPAATRSSRSACTRSSAPASGRGRRLASASASLQVRVRGIDHVVGERLATWG